MFNEKDHDKLATLFDPRAGYAGYKPNVIEAPNGDGNLDHTKRYLHVAPKYNPPDWALEFLARAHYEACEIAEMLGVPADYYPRVADGTLRVLEYPPGAGSAQHTDFDLFTVALYRSSPDLVFDDATDDAEQSHAYRERLRYIHPGLHIGEIGELVGLGPATPHHVKPAAYVQRSIVYFAMPDHAAGLPYVAGRDAEGPRPTVGAWLKERIARSRY